MKSIGKRITALLPEVAVILLLVFTLTGRAAAQTCVQPPADLVSWWPGDGHARDISGVNHGTLQGGATFAPGAVGQAFSFDGVDDIVAIGTPADLAFTTASSLSIDAWINTPTPAGATNSVIVGQANLTQLFLIAGSGKLRFATQTPSGALVGFDSNGAIPLNTWTHVALTYDALAQIGRMYIDGLLDSEVPLGSFQTFVVHAGPPGPWEIGGFTGFNVFFNGMIDEIEIFKRALFASEIQEIVSAGKCKPPDLLVTAVSNPPAVALLGGKLPVTDTTRSQGDAAAGASTTRYYLSLDAVRNAGDKLLSGSRKVPMLPPGTESTGTVTVKILASTKLGAYFLLGCADDTKLVAESDETNNCHASAGRVEVRAPDLVETAVSNPSATAKPGDSFAVTDTARNQGNAAAGGSTTRYYISFDTRKSAGDTLLTGSRAVPSLPPGATSTDTAMVTIPATTAAGSYFLLACADDLKKVVESNEKNNCKASATQVTVGP